ncbi:acid phosphatase/Vanadium-dependent haloperoxidase [Microstroma glucosiphilum]|uniref:Acid phosphatase/Vanadium-dependent haloperoxidase n=1 Tax=Pseudomicrostroma glucosiphilum TaxID=1684307 RepID=A0A316UBH2_9BASI|nr:acid phosphatase/Vanadium-dependent haloperoxidase [Pseudomicrostroma glucosiphilum]PWN21753.1 acid phosphatase/Vanadium-dependent haloperoxidase [Pseudomicrostroma glucosiphilum]
MSPRAPGTPDSRTGLTEEEGSYDTLQGSWEQNKNEPAGSVWARALRLLRAYAGDWILTILLAGTLWSLNRAYGFRSPFSLDDKSIQYRHIPNERVPTALLIACAFVVPVMLQATVSLGLSRLDWYDFHQSALGLLLTHGITLTVTTCVKISVGRTRPDFIDRCQPPVGAVDPVPYGLNSEAICTTSLDSALIKDGFRSFPSGHSSAAFAGLTFLTWFLAGHFHLFGDRARVWVSWIVATPPLGACLIAISRLMDNRHHPTDVIAGAILGAVVASSIYHQYYPPLWAGDGHRPYKPSAPPSSLVMTPAEREHFLRGCDNAAGDLESGRAGDGEASGRHTSTAV